MCLVCGTPPLDKPCSRRRHPDRCCHLHSAPHPSTLPSPAALPAPSTRYPGFDTLPPTPSNKTRRPLPMPTCTFHHHHCYLHCELPMYAHGACLAAHQLAMHATPPPHQVCHCCYHSPIAQLPRDTTPAHHTYNALASGEHLPFSLLGAGIPVAGARWRHWTTDGTCSCCTSAYLHHMDRRTKPSAGLRSERPMELRYVLLANSNAAVTTILHLPLGGLSADICP